MSQRHLLVHKLKKKAYILNTLNFRTLAKQVLVTRSIVNYQIKMIIMYIFFRQLNILKKYRLLVTRH